MLAPVAAYSTLIFATVTPCSDNVTNPLRLPGMPANCNAVAGTVMQNNNIMINDLYSLVLPRLNEPQIPNNVHFTEAGYKVPGERVSDIIVENLQK